MTILRDVLRLWREMFTDGPDWLAWRLEAFTVRMNDQRLSLPVQDALAGRRS